MQLKRASAVTLAALIGTLLAFAAPAQQGNSNDNNGGTVAGNPSSSGGAGSSSSSSSSGGGGAATSSSTADTCTAEPPSGNSAPNCSTVMHINVNRLFRVDARLIHHCMTQGWDPPSCWRSDNGVGGPTSGEGSSGFAGGYTQDPAHPPGCATTDDNGDCVGAAPDVSDLIMRFALRFPPWQGWPFSTSDSKPSSSSSSSSSSSGGGGSSCPTSQADTSGTFGAQQKLTAGSAPLACGGAIPLTTYDMALNANADSLLVTEYGQPYYWLWHRTGNIYTLISQTGAKLPASTCGGAALPLPVAQMISFSSNATQLPIRLIQTAAAGDPLSPPTPPEQYLLLPLSGGSVAGSSGNCVAANNYAAPGAHLADVTYRTVSNGGCEAPAATCQAMGQSTTPTALSNCQLQTNYPSSSGGSCNGDVQMALLDRPNLIDPPGSAVPAASIDSMTAVMVGTTTGSAIYAQEGAVIELGSASPDFTLPNGGTLGLTDGDTLAINGPATISGAGRLTLTNGGTITSANGNVIIPDDSTLAIASDGTITVSSQTGQAPTISSKAFFPLTLTPNGILGMPAGYWAPTSPDAEVRLPVTPPS